MNSAPTATLAMVSIDCKDAEGVTSMTAFYSALLGWEVAVEGEGYAMLQGPDQRVGFGEVPDYQPPSWPNEGTKQFHFDLSADDVAVAVDRALELGATRPPAQPGAGRWTVLLDPAGHPFCITPAANWE